MHTPFHRAQSGAVRGCGGTGSVAHGLYPRPAMGPIGRPSPPPWPGTCLQRQEVKPFHLIPQHCRAPREKHFSMTLVMDLLLFPKRVYLGTHTQTVSSRLLCTQWRQARQGAAEAVRQIRPCFRRKKNKKRKLQMGEREALESLLIVVCCQMRLTLSSVQTEQPRSSSHFSDSLARSPFLLRFSLMRFQSGKQTSAQTFIRMQCTI